MENMGTSLHYLHIYRRGVRTLAIGNGIHKSVTKFFTRSKQVGFHKTNHTMIWNQQWFMIQSEILILVYIYKSPVFTMKITEKFDFILIF